MSDTINSAVIKRLFALSAGRCNICNVSLFVNDVNLSQMAHIIAKSPRGARGDEGNRNNNSYENLILLCPNHHVIVDNDPVTYTVEKLNQIKSKHEAHIANATDNSKFLVKNRQSDVQFLNAYFHHTPFYRLLSLVEMLPHSFNTKFLIFSDQFDSILMDFPASYPLNDATLQGHFQNFIQPYNHIVDFLCGVIQVSEERYIEIFGGADFNLLYHFNYRELPSDEASRIEKDLIEQKKLLINAYHGFIKYLREDYPDVEIYGSLV